MDFRTGNHPRCRTAFDTSRGCVSRPLMPWFLYECCHGRPWWSDLPLFSFLSITPPFFFFLLNFPSPPIGDLLLHLLQRYRSRIRKGKLKSWDHRLWRLQTWSDSWGWTSWPWNSLPRSSDRVSAFRDSRFRFLPSDLLDIIPWIKNTDLESKWPSFSALSWCFEVFWRINPEVYFSWFMALLTVGGRVIGDGPVRGVGWSRMCQPHGCSKKWVFYFALLLVT